MLAEQALTQLGREVKKDTKVPRGRIAMCHLFDLSGVEGLEIGRALRCTCAKKHEINISSRSFLQTVKPKLWNGNRDVFILASRTVAVASVTFKYWSQDVLSWPLCRSEGLLADRGSDITAGIGLASPVFFPCALQCCTQRPHGAAICRSEWTLHF